MIPFGSVIGNRARLAGLNVIGLRRRGADRAVLHALRSAVRELFSGAGVFADRLEYVRAAHGDEPLVAEVLAFIDAPSKRGLIRASQAADGGGTPAWAPELPALGHHCRWRSIFRGVLPRRQWRQGGRYLSSHCAALRRPH